MSVNGTICCRNRHGPNCDGIKKEQWLHDRMSELLPTTYYPDGYRDQELSSLIMGNGTILFNLLFEASHHTINLLSFDKKWLGAKPGIVSILHTNGQDLSFHPHIHCIVSGGGIDTNGKWVKEKRLLCFINAFLNSGPLSYTTKCLGDGCLNQFDNLG